MNQQTNILGQVGKQFGGIAKAVTKRVVREPMEVMKNAVGMQTENQLESEGDNQAMEALEQAVMTNTQQSNTSGTTDDVGSSFKTQDDFKQYVEKSQNKDELELRMARRELAKEWGVEVGMDKARKEYQQKEEERLKVEEQEKQEAEAMKFEKKKVEDAQIVAAKNQASAEKRGMMG